ncbi:BTB/POZ protein [Rhizophagus irregularis DAOM 181602=DAOM 197198]|nr:BTB/POZ protein [Rhizophagus irregularis DAOM 181602=DAOM 197198]
MVDNELLPNLTENLLGTLNDNNGYHDIIIEVGSDPNVKTFHISPNIFDIILKYIYGGRLSLKEYDTSVIIKILVVANPSKIFNSPNFSTISEKLLVSLIQNKNAQMRVVQIWEHVVKWGLAQNPELPSNTKEFTKDQFIALENTSKNIIPLIKFHYFLDSDNEKSEPSTSKEINETNIDSKIITLQKAELISKWIDKSDELTTSYKFNYIVDLMKHLPDLIEKRNNNNILSHVVDEKNAVYNSYYVGPLFGNCDLEI